MDANTPPEINNLSKYAPIKLWELHRLALGKLNVSPADFPATYFKSWQEFRKAVIVEIGLRGLKGSLS